MDNVFDYLRWRGDLRFLQDPPNAVDALIFSSLVYLNFSGTLVSDPFQPVSLRDAAGEFLGLEDPIAHARMKNDVLLLQAASECERFASVRMVRYRNLLVPEEDTQFAAITFLLDDGSCMIAFRGTDNTLIGWKEDFNMSFQQTVPAQRIALEYTREIYAEYSGMIRLCGHSKGGNLAVFAAARSSPMMQERIAGVYNLDGPGFTDYMMGDPGYKAMVPRISTFVPQSSIIGLLMEHEEPCTIIHSNQVSVMQHDTYSWEILGKSFVPVEELTADSRFVRRTLQKWLNELDREERNQMVDAIFGVLMNGEAKSVHDALQPKHLLSGLKLLGADSRHQVLAENLHGLLDAVKYSRLLPEHMQGFVVPELPEEAEKAPEAILEP